MSSGNPYGLSSISHYGSMQRVGGKAAGFINKKFFHPSSLRNQEKLWLAQTAHEVETKKQDEMEKRRVEERQVEEIRKQMYLAGQATKGTDFLSGLSAGSAAPQKVTKDQKLAFEEQQRRKSLLKQERAAREDQTLADEDELCELPDDNIQNNNISEAELLASLAKSNYREDVHVRGHSTVWGSWYATEDRKWGYTCCKSLDRQKRCPLAPDEDDEDSKAKAKAEPRTRGKRRRRGAGNAAHGGITEADVADEEATLMANPSADEQCAAQSVHIASGSSVLPADVSAVEDQILSDGASTKPLESNLA